MAESGYHTEVLDEGRALYERSLEALAVSNKEREEMKAAFRKYTEAYGTLRKMHSMHRRKARVAFRINASALSKLELNRAMPERAESQNATGQKHAALRATDEWMRDFFAIAKIATRKQPRLREAFGKVVKIDRARG